MIRGERVTLRPVEEADHASIHVWQNDPEVWWLKDCEAPFSLADIAENEKRATERSWKDGRWVDRILMSVTRASFEAARACGQTP